MDEKMCAGPLSKAPSRDLPRKRIGTNILAGPEHIDRLVKSMGKGVVILTKEKMMPFVFYCNIHPAMKLLSYPEIAAEGVSTPPERTGCKEYAWDMKEDI